MRLLLHVLASLSLASLAAAFGEYGACERVYMWKLRQWETALGEEKDHKIAPGCGGEQKPCDFAEFMDHIKGPSRENVKDPEPLSGIQGTESVRDLVGLLEAKHHTGVIDKEKVISRGRDEEFTYSTFLNRLHERAQYLAGVAKQRIDDGDAALLRLSKDVAKAAAYALQGRKQAAIGMQPFAADSSGEYKIPIHLARHAGKNRYEYNMDEMNRIYKGILDGDKLHKALEDWLPAHGNTRTQAKLKEFFEDEIAPFKVPVKENEDGGLVADWDTVSAKQPWLKMKELKEMHGAHTDAGHQQNIDKLVETSKGFRQTLGRPIMKEVMAEIKAEPCGTGSRRKRAAGNPCGFDDSFLWEREGKGMDAPAGEAGKAPTGAAGKEQLGVDMAKANEASERAFEELAEKFNVVHVPTPWVSKGVQSLSDVRSKMLGYKRLEETSLKPSSGRGGSTFGKIAAKAGKALWVAGVIETFVTESTTLDKFTALFAMAPFLGCGFSIANNKAHGQSDLMVAIDGGLCLLGDALLASGLVPLGLLVHGVRLMMDLVKMPKDLPGLDEALKMRNELWDDYLGQRFYPFIYSHVNRYPEQLFAAKLNGTLAAVKYGVLSDAADAIAAVEVTAGGSKGNATAAAAGGGGDVGKARAGITDSLQLQIARLQRDHLFSVARGMNKGAKDVNSTLYSAAKDVQQGFLDHLKSDKTAELYAPGLATQGVLNNDGNSRVVLPWETRHKADRLDPARQKLKALADQVAKHPINQMLPLEFGAFVVGQSQGLRHVDVKDPMLSPQAYINQVARDRLNRTLDEGYVRNLVIVHAVDVLERMQKPADKQPTKNEPFPAVPEADRHVRELRMVIALKYGRIVELQKIGRAKGYTGDFPTKAVFPATPHLKGDGERREVRLAAILDQQQEVPASAWSEKAKMDLARETESMKLTNEGGKKEAVRQ